MIDETMYTISCPNGHELEADADEVETYLDCPSCPECEEDFCSIDPELFMQCSYCQDEVPCDWESAVGCSLHGCTRCETNIDTASEMYVAGSHRQVVWEYLDYIKSTNSAAHLANDRLDYWEVVIHFCTEEELVSILASKTIKAAVTGYFGLPAVCLTETPLPYSDRIRAKHGTHGFAFKKSDILGLGGGPALYIPERILASQKQVGLCKEIMPFINLLRTRATHPSKRKYDFLDEREWRVPTNIDLNSVRPLGLIFPKGSCFERFGGADWRNLITWAVEYGTFE